MSEPKIPAPLLRALRRLVDDAGGPGVVSRQLGVHPTTLHAILRGASDPPVSRVEALARIGGMHLAIVDDDDEGEPKADGGGHADEAKQAAPEPIEAERGGRIGTARIDEAAVVEMRRLRAEGRNTVEIAKQFGLPESLVRQAVYGMTWKHVPMP